METRKGRRRHHSCGMRHMSERTSTQSPSNRNAAFLHTTHSRLRVHEKQSSLHVHGMPLSTRMLPTQNGSSGPSHSISEVEEVEVDVDVDVDVEEDEDVDEEVEVEVEVEVEEDDDVDVELEVDVDVDVDVVTSTQRRRKLPCPASR